MDSVIYQKERVEVINPTEYVAEEDLHDTYATAKDRKQVLRDEGFRVKIIKNADGKYEIWKKNVAVISIQRDSLNNKIKRCIENNQR